MSMARYSIKDLENFTNIKAHTLRIWEQRYNLLAPERTETNIRYYSDVDLKKILNVQLLYSNGLKISKIAGLTDNEIIERASIILKNSGGAVAEVVDHFIKLIVDADEKAIIEKLNHIKDKQGFESLYVDVLIPVLLRVGELWQLDTLSVSDEHFFSNIIREYFIIETGKIELTQPLKGKVILFLHENEQHELSLLFYNYSLKKLNYECFYLGQSVPLGDLKSFVKHKKPDFLFTSLIADISEDYFNDWINELSLLIEPDKIFMSGNQLNKLANFIPTQVNQIQSFTDFEKYFV